MPLIAFIAVLTGFALALSSLDPALLRPSVASLAALIALAATLAPQARRSLGSLAARHQLGLAAIAAVIAIFAVRSLLKASAPLDLVAPAYALAAFIGIALAGLAAAVAAHAYGRGSLSVALLLTSIPVAFTALLANGVMLGGPLGRIAPALDAPALVVGFGLVVILAVHVVADELRRRPSPGKPSLAPLARRLFAPVASIVTSLAMLVIARASEELGAAAAGSLVLLGGLWPRARRSRAVMPVLAVVSIATASLAVWSAALVGGARAADAAPAAETGFSIWLAQAGVLGAGASALVVVAVALVLITSNDRGRRPSRGAALLAGAGVYGAIASWYGPGLTAAPAGLLFAVITGLAASYLDAETRTSDPA